MCSKLEIYTAQKMKFPIKHFFSKRDQICRKLRIWSHLLNKSLMKNFIFLRSDTKQTFKMESFGAIVNGFLPVIIVGMLSILDVCEVTGFAFKIQCWMCLMLTHYQSVFPLCKSQSIDSQSKSIDWFLYERNVVR